jgi:hypothetical protein
MLEAIDQHAGESPVICLETTGTAGYFPEFLRRLHARYRLRLVRVMAPAEACVARIRQRDRTQHIPVSGARVGEINRLAAAVSLPWDLEVDNSEDGDLDMIVAALTHWLETCSGR